MIESQYYRSLLNYSFKKKGVLRMKKLMATAIVAAALVVGGCNESQTVTQLKLEKAQIVSEFEETKTQMQATIDEQAQTITTLEAKVQEQKNTIEGYNNILFEIMPENEKLKKEIESLKANTAKKETDPAVTQQKLEELKALQQKAIDQKK